MVVREGVDQFAHRSLEVVGELFDCTDDTAAGPGFKTLESVQWV
ncbi:hypothetical protein [Natronobacterium gregoryi]|nr:hypothetical protein [Natronobacterium gregoryi]